MNSFSLLESHSESIFCSFPSAKQFKTGMKIKERRMKDYPDDIP
jgi:hypothetical protein